MPAKGLKPKGKHRRPRHQDATTVPNDLSQRFLNGDGTAVDQMKELMWTTEAANPFDTHIEIPRTKPARVRRTAAAALLAVGILNPNTANTSAAHPQETVAAVNANNHGAANLDLTGMLNDMANYEADPQAAANTANHGHTTPTEQPENPTATHPYPPHGNR